MLEPSLHYSKEHEAFREQIRRFVDREIAPRIEEWEAAGELPRELHRKAAEIGVLGVGFPEADGGIEVPDSFFRIVITEELARVGSGGLLASLMSYLIAIPPIITAGSLKQRQRFVAPVLAGEKVAALAITEPSGGSDVANLKTTARRDGDHYIVNGQKTFITSGMRADYITTAVRTGGEGSGGISLLVIESNTPGLARTPLQKMGWWCSDTATLYFDECRIPAENLLGYENDGFKAIMVNFNSERIFMASEAWAFAQVCFDEALGWARERHSFGEPLIARQVIRHKLVDMKTRIDSVKAQLDVLVWRTDQGQAPVAEICMLKNLATTTLEYVANEAMQILGGAGYIRGSRVERIYRETKPLTIGGGSLEIMKDLAARQMDM